jgi:hypothetical protein
MFSLRYRVWIGTREKTKREGTENGKSRNPTREVYNCYALAETFMDYHKSQLIVLIYYYVR